MADQLGSAVLTGTATIAASGLVFDAVVTVADIQEFLEPSQLVIDSVPAGIEESQRQIVFGRLRRRFDVDSWTNSGNTPKVVRTAIAMLVASVLDTRAHASSNGETATYANDLRTWAYDLINDLVDGIIELAP